MYISCAQPAPSRFLSKYRTIFGRFGQRFGVQEGLSIILWGARSTKPTDQIVFQGEAKVSDEQEFRLIYPETNDPFSAELHWRLNDSFSTDQKTPEINELIAELNNISQKLHEFDSDINELHENISKTKEATGILLAEIRHLSI